MGDQIAELKRGNDRLGQMVEAMRYRRDAVRLAYVAVALAVLSVALNIAAILLR